MQEMPTVCLVGHTDYSLHMRSSELTLPFGEVNNAKKLHTALKELGIPTSDILDFFELFEIEDMKDERGLLLTEMHTTNVSIGDAGLDFITDYRNVVSEAFQKNIIKACEKNHQTVLLFLSWAGRTLSMLSTGIQRHYPTIGKEDSYIQAFKLPDHFPMKKFADEVNIITSESLLGALNLQFYGVSLDKFIYLPNLAPPESTELLKRSSEEKKKYREQYIRSLAEQNNKEIRFDEDTIIIGCPSRFVRRKNVDILIYAIAELVKKHSNIILVLKGNMDPEFDIFSLYTEKLHQLLQSAEEQSWFLWDKSSTPYPEVLKMYATFNICAHLSGAELGCNTVVEVCSLGVPTLLLDASVNPFLYKGMVEFVRAGKLCHATWLYQQPDLQDLQDKLKDLVLSFEKRSALGEKSRNLAEKRFGAHQLIKRVPLMTKAAYSFFHKDEEVASYKDAILQLLAEDLKEYDVNLPKTDSKRS